MAVLQELINDLESSHARLQERIEVMNSILEQFRVTTSTKPLGNTRVESIDTPLPILKWAFRWLLRQLNEVACTPSDTDLQTSFWILLGKVIRSIPATSLASSLKNVELLHSMAETLAIPRTSHLPDHPATRRQSSSETLVGTDASAVPGPTISNSLKRKRGISHEVAHPDKKLRNDKQHPTNPKDPAPGLVPVAKCLQQMVNKIEGSPTQLRDYGQENLLLTLSVEPDKLSVLLARALVNIRCTIPEQFDGENGSQFARNLEQQLKPFLALWYFRPADDTESQLGRSVSGPAHELCALSDFSQKLFCSLCLSPALSLLSDLGQGIKTPEIDQLKDLIVQLAISPLKSNYLNAGDKKPMSEDTGFLDEIILSLFELPSPDASGDSLICNAYGDKKPPETIFFDLASSQGFKNTVSRSQTEQKWLAFLFRHLCGINPGEQAQNMTRDHGREITVQEQLLHISQQKGIQLERSMLESLITLTLVKYRGQTLDATAWKIIGRCITIDPDIVLSQSKDTELGLKQKPLREANKTTKVLLSHALKINRRPLDNFPGSGRRHIVEATNLSEVDVPDVVVAQFILPLLQAHIRTRQLDKFIICWHEELAKARAHMLEHAPTEDVSNILAESIWEDPSVLAAVAVAIPAFSYQIPKLWKKVIKSIKPKNQSTPDQGHLSLSVKLHSTCVVISTITCGINSESLRSDLESEALKLGQRLTEHLCDDDYQSCENLIWATQSRLLECWPGNYAGLANIEDLISLAMKAVQRGVKHCSSASNGHLTAFYAAAFLWRCRYACSVYRWPEKLDEIIDISKVGKLFCTMLDMSSGLRDSHPQQALLKSTVEAFIILILEQPMPLYSMKSRWRQKLFHNLWKLALNGQVSPETGGETNSSLMSRHHFELLERVLKKWTSFDCIKDDKEAYQDTCETALEIVEELFQAVKGAKDPSADTIHLWLSILANRASHVWTRPQQEELLKRILDMLDVMVHEKDEQGTQLAMAVFERVMNQKNGHQLPLRIRNSVRNHLSSLSAVGENRGNELSPQAFQKIQHLLDLDAEDALNKDWYHTTNIAPDSTREDARRVFAGFEKAFADADTQNRVQIISTHLTQLRTEKSLDNLIYARKLCGIRLDEDDRTGDIGDALQELLSCLFSITSTSQSMKHVLLAQKAINVAIKKNGWMLSQMHVDLGFASATCLPWMRGDQEKDDPPSPSPVEPEKEPPKSRSRLNLASAQRLVFGSLGLRTPKTKEDGVKLRQKLDSNRASGSVKTNLEETNTEPQELENDPPTNKVKAPDARLSPALYSALCDTVSALLLHHRARIGGRWHLVAGALRSLLTCLFEPYHPSTSLPWIAGSSLTAAHATAFCRLLTLLCEPSASAAATISASKKKSKKADNATQLRDDVKRAKEVAGQHLSLVLKTYCASSLRGQLAPEKKTSLMPGLFALLNAVGRDGTAVLNEGLSRLEREIFRGLWDEYLKFGKWSGK